MSEKSERKIRRENVHLTEHVQCTNDSMTLFFLLPVTSQPTVDMTISLWTAFPTSTPALSVPRSFMMLTSLPAVASTSVPPASPTGLVHSRGGRHARTADSRTSST